MKQSELRQLIREQIELEENKYSAEDIGKGIAAIIAVPFEIAIALIILVGVAIVAGIRIVTNIGRGLYAGAEFAARRLIRNPILDAAFKRLAEDPEVLEYIKNPRKSGLRTVLVDKLNPAEKAIIGKWITQYGSRRNLGYSTRGTKLKQGPGLDRDDIDLPTYE